MISTREVERRLLKKKMVGNNTVYNVYILTYTCSQKHNKLTDDITM
jgi:hypothetical protein